MATDWSKTSSGSAASFGWSLAVINSNPELKKIFAQATKENWTPDHFVAKVRDTKWFKSHSASVRQAIILAKADPATFRNNLAQTQATLGAMAHQMGAMLTSAQLHSMATQAFEFGWNSDQMRNALVGHISAGKSGAYSSDAATAQQQYNQIAGQYGLSVPASVMAHWVRATATGELNSDEVKNWAIQQASSRYPSLADRLKAGETVMDIASPYFQSYAQTLEVNPNSISLKDPLIQAALSGKDKEGKPSTKTLWQFENDLRNDPRYMKTQQAQDKVMAVGHQVLRDFGFMGN